MDLPDRSARSSKGAPLLPCIFALIFALEFAIGITGRNLYTIAQIKGWFHGATAADRTVTQKWSQPPSRRHPLEQDTYWIAITEEDIRKVGPHRLNLTLEKWSNLKVGDKIEIISVPGDIFVSNFATDLVFLGVELGVAGWMAWQLLRRLIFLPLSRS